MNSLDRIAVDPTIRFGKPCLRGTRISVGDVLGYLAGGALPEQSNVHGAWKDVGQRLAQLFRQRLIEEEPNHLTRRAWAQLRQKTDGSHLLLVGRPIRGALPAGEEYGHPVNGYSWPDRRVVESVVANFAGADRLVLLTANSKRDREGLHRLITGEVAPTIKEHHPGRFGLLVLMKSGKTSWEVYASALLKRLASQGVAPGFEYLRVSSRDAV